ncbi:MAG: formate/nitrite transporter family protein [Clostridia bacterium]|nr:formate/nitrite transporter family protein [Clostridia bacterium]
MKILKDFVSAFLAGFMISLGGAVLLACENKVVGAIMFSVGLTVILLFSFLLFTGKTAYVFQNKPSYLLTLCLIWIGNIVGCMAVGALVFLSKPALSETAVELCTKKLTQTPIQTIILGALCGILVYIAVDFFRSDDDKKHYAKYLLVFTCVPVFILCGFEHSVADMFYFAASKMLYTGEGIIYILWASLGNLIGAVVVQTLRLFIKEKTAK